MSGLLRKQATHPDGWSDKNAKSLFHVSSVQLIHCADMSKVGHKGDTKQNQLDSIGMRSIQWVQTFLHSLGGDLKRH